MLNISLLALGIVLLTIGGEVLIRGALGAARRLGVSPLLSGLVIVGFGTSSPELAVTVDAAISGRPDIAVGNIVGSNISNMMLVLAVCALITPLVVQPLALRRDAVMGLAASFLFVILATGTALGRIEAGILLAALAAYLVWAYRTERVEDTPEAVMHKAEAEEVTTTPAAAWSIVAAVVVGLGLLIGGSRVLLVGAVGIAEYFGVPEAVIALTLVAVGTSLPELSITVLAAIRRHADVAVGNILGSNIFNVLGVLGISAMLQPLPVNERILQFDQWVMLGAAAILLPFLYTGRHLSRVEGGLLLAGYGAYLALSFTVFGG